MSELLQEFVDSGSQRLRVDRAAGVIRGVKLLGLNSRNGRRYREDALDRGHRPVRRREGQHQPSEGPSAVAPRLSGSARAWCAACSFAAAKGCSAICISIRATRFRSNWCGMPSMRRKTSACRTTCWLARNRRAMRRSSKRSRRCKASTSWPTQPRPAGCMSRRKAGEQDKR